VRQGQERTYTRSLPSPGHCHRHGVQIYACLSPGSICRCSIAASCLISRLRCSEWSPCRVMSSRCKATSHPSPWSCVSSWSSWLWARGYPPLVSSAVERPTLFASRSSLSDLVRFNVFPVVPERCGINADTSYIFKFVYSTRVNPPTHLECFYTGSYVC
jgi:hypothetical protein